MMKLRYTVSHVLNNSGIFYTPFTTYHLQFNKGVKINTDETGIIPESIARCMNCLSKQPEVTAHIGTYVARYFVYIQ